MMISVVLATYNGEAYIEKQLESLRTQTCPPDEVILVDDCSTDQTVSKIQAFLTRTAMPNWTVDINESNMGYRRNFAKAIAQSKGDIVFLCDQDDVWHADKIEKMQDIFSKYPDAMSVNASFDVVDADDTPMEAPEKKGWCNHGLIPGESTQGEVRKLQSCRAANPTMLIRSNVSPGCTMAFRDTVRVIYLEKTTCDIPHDWEINIIADAMDGLYFYNESLIDYRIHGKNTIGFDGQSAIAKMPYMIRRKKHHEVVAAAANTTAKYVKNTSVGEALVCYATLRARFLERGRMQDWIALWRKSGKLYVQTVSWKGCLGDLLVLVRMLLGRAN